MLSTRKIQLQTLEMLGILGVSRVLASTKVLN